MKVAVSPIGFQGFLRVAKMSETLQTVISYIIFEVLGNLIQHVIIIALTTGEQY